MDSNQSSYFLQQTSEDGSIDWNNFSFKSELATRKENIKQDLEEFKTYATYITSDSGDTKDIIKLSQENEDKRSRLLKDNKTIWSKYDNLIAKRKSLKEKLDKLLSKRNALKDEIKKCEEEEMALRKTYQLQKTALARGIEMYTTNFDLDLDIKSASDSTYEALLKCLSLKDSSQVKFNVDRTKRKVLGFDISRELTLPKENLDKYTGDPPNLPGLLCLLRNISDCNGKQD